MIINIKQNSSVNPELLESLTSTSNHIISLVEMIITEKAEKINRSFLNKPKALAESVITDVLKGGNEIIFTYGGRTYAVDIRPSKLTLSTFEPQKKPVVNF